MRLIFDRFALFCLRCFLSFAIFRVSQFVFCPCIFALYFCHLLFIAFSTHKTIKNCNLRFIHIYTCVSLVPRKFVLCVIFCFLCLHSLWRIHMNEDSVVLPLLLSSFSPPHLALSLGNAIAAFALF